MPPALPAPPAPPASPASPALPAPSAHFMHPSSMVPGKRRHIAQRTARSSSDRNRAGGAMPACGGALLCRRRDRERQRRTFDCKLATRPPLSGTRPRRLPLSPLRRAPRVGRAADREEGAAAATGTARVSCECLLEDGSAANGFRRRRPLNVRKHGGGEPELTVFVSVRLLV